MVVLAFAAAAVFFGAAALAVLLGVPTPREACKALDLAVLVLPACLIPISRVA